MFSYLTKEVLLPGWILETFLLQVSEVLSKEKCRLSVSGWFYGESIPRPPTYIQERKLPEVGRKLEVKIVA